MKVKNPSDFINSHNHVMTIGKFDGVHLGHQYLFDQMKRESDSCKLVALTFAPHPKVFFSNITNYLLCSPEEKERLFINSNVDYLWEIPFNKELSSLSAEGFIAKYIEAIPNLKKIIVGHDFRFGAKQLGDYQLLEKVLSPKGVQVCPQEEYLHKGLKVSSSSIRECISNRQISRANSLLGRSYSINGKVVHGKKIGRTIGIPTANLLLDKARLTPPGGVYITETVIDGDIFKSVTNIGSNPTVDDQIETKVETHILDFDQDIYDRTISIQFKCHLRDEKKFNDIEELKTMIENDLESCRKYFKEHS